MDRYDRAAVHEPWHDPAFRAAAKTHEQGVTFLALCKKADAKGHELSENQKRLRKFFEGKCS